MAQKESRSLTISKKVFTKEDLVKLAGILEEEAAGAPGHNDLSFRVSFTDESSYESSSHTLFSEGVIDEKIATAITMDYSNWQTGRRITFSATAGGTYGRSYTTDRFTVTDQDGNWVRGLYTRVEEMLNSVRPQDNWLLRHQTLAKNTLSFLVGLFMQAILKMVFNPLLDTAFGRNPTWASNATVHQVVGMLDVRIAVVILLFVLIWLSGLGFGNMLVRWFVKLWPDIEFRFGPTHLNRKSQVRKRIGAIMILVVIPIVVAIFANVITPFFTG